MLYLTEVIIALLSSAGVMGTVIACILKRAMKNAEIQAEQRRKAKLEEDLARYELDCATSALLIALAKYARGKCNETELEVAEANYTASVAKSDFTIRRHYFEERCKKK
jgi:hypothetical protein